MNKDLVIKKIIIPGIILTIVAFVSGLLLSHVNKITSSRIAAIKERKVLNSIALVLPGYTDIKQFMKQVEGKDFKYWIGTKKNGDSAVKGYAFITSAPGFEDKVVSMVGVDEKGNVLGLSILDQKETPGFGARCIEVASDKSIWGVIANLFGGKNGAAAGTAKPWFQEQFIGLDLNNKLQIEKMGNWTPAMRETLLQKNAITAITGATVTSTAVTESLKRGMILLKNVADINRTDK